jgi:hypothetical protein
MQRFIAIPVLVLVLGLVWGAEPSYAQRSILKENLDRPITKQNSDGRLVPKPKFKLPPKVERKTYVKPRYSGGELNADEDRLDWCLVLGKECGKPVAEEFCKRRRYTGASDLRIDPRVASVFTRTIGMNERCWQCDGFDFITCYGPISVSRVKANPIWCGRNHNRNDFDCQRLDACPLRKVVGSRAIECNTTEHQMAANAWCRALGFTWAFHYVLDPQPNRNYTRYIETDELCIPQDPNNWTPGNPCRGFQQIICQ